MTKCGICGQETENPHIIELTEAEKSNLDSPPDRCVYCQPCWKILSNPALGPTLMKGLALQRLRSFGVLNAEEIASRYYAALVTKATRRPS